jgi:hypothetical protein
MVKEVKNFTKKNIILSIALILCLIIMGSYGYMKFMPEWFSRQATYNVVKEAFLTNKGYSSELSKHMSQQVFERTNIYNAYALNAKEVYKVDFNLNEDSLIKIADKVYVKMTYSVKIMDLQNQIVGGSWDVQIIFTVKNINNEWYITQKQELA